jgi:hypothetical protein
LIAVRAPIRRSPYGEFRKPFTPCHTAPPIACVQRICQRVLGIWGDNYDGSDNSSAEVGDSGPQDLKHHERGDKKIAYPHTEGSPKVIQCHPGARVSRMIHLVEICSFERPRLLPPAFHQPRNSSTSWGFWLYLDAVRPSEAVRDARVQDGRHLIVVPGLLALNLFFMEASHHTKDF